MKSLTWSIFCRVIDNYGEAGVCLRLAKELASKNQRIRLWIDEPNILNWMAPNLDPNISVYPWPVLPTKEAYLVDVVLEAFGCEIPAFIQEEISNSVYTVQRSNNQYQRQRIQWINLEYLSGEAYAKKNHGLMSPILSGIGSGATKWFFYPGFEEGTGGLLLEDMTRRRIHESENTLPKSVATLTIGIFCYHDAPLKYLISELIQQFNNQASKNLTKFTLNVAPGQAQLKLKNEIAPLLLDRLLKDEKSDFSFNYLKYMSQEDFDDYHYKETFESRQYYIPKEEPKQETFYNKLDVLKDLHNLQSKFHHVHKYYPLSDKELTKDNFDNIIEDLIKYIQIYEK